VLTFYLCVVQSDSSNVHMQHGRPSGGAAGGTGGGGGTTGGAAGGTTGAAGTSTTTGNQAGTPNGQNVGNNNQQGADKKKVSGALEHGTGVYASNEGITGFDGSVTQTGISSLATNAYPGNIAQGMPGFFNINQMLFQPTDPNIYLAPGQGSYGITFNYPAIFQWVYTLRVFLSVTHPFVFLPMIGVANLSCRARVDLCYLQQPASPSGRLWCVRWR